MDDPYTTLGVARDASPERIQRAYRKLAKVHHPDLNPGDKQAEERFKTVSAAHKLLSDPDKRDRFDRGEIYAGGQERTAQPFYRDYADSAAGCRYGPAGQEPDHGGFDDLFGSMFNRRREGGPAMRGQDERYAVYASFLEAVAGATRRLTLPDGRTLDVKIPPGSLDGQVLRLRGQGGGGWNGEPAGDAMIELSVAPHPVFTRDGRDVRLVLPVDLRDATLGGPVEVPTPGGPVRMQMPPRSDSGTELRLRGVASRPMPGWPRETCMPPCAS
ncbi:MAG: DnaJ C-terminal domain-containing protein [Janthinobacterium lividum]